MIPNFKTTFKVSTASFTQTFYLCTSAHLKTDAFPVMQDQSYKQDYDLNWIILSGFFNPEGRTDCAQTKHQFTTTLNAFFFQESQLVQKYWEGTVKVSFQALQMNAKTNSDQVFMNSSQSLWKCASYVAFHSVF